MTIQHVEITDPNDPRIADYTSVRERDLTGRDGKFIVEGKVTLDIFLKRSRFDVESVFLETGRLPLLKNQLSHLPANVPLYTADQSVMDQIVGFPIHRGILACGRKPEPSTLSDWLSAQSDKSTLVICIGLSNHDNAGAVFRNAAALAGEAIILDETSCDPLYRKSIRVSAGTALWMPFFHGSTGADIVSAVRNAGYQLWSLTPGEGTVSLFEAEHPEKVAIMLGPEGPGLPDDLIAAGQAVRIPMADNVDSLNVATSLAVTLSHRMAACN